MSNRSRIESLILIVLFIFTFMYIIIRAYSVPIIHDEAATFFYYIQSGIFMPPEAHIDANNHILNSALAHFSYLLFGSSEFILRLPSVLFFPLFFAYVIKIANNIKNRTLSYAFIISLILSHSFIEYFALSRGYGMSMALLLAAIFHLFETIKHNKIKDYILTTVFISFAILANLTIVISGLIISIILIINTFKSSKIIQKIGIIMVFLVLPLIWFIALLFEYKASGNLYYGSLDGFWILTVKSLIKVLFTSNILIEIIVGLLSIFIVFVLFYKLFTKKLLSLWNPSNVFPVLLLANVSAILILAYILEVNFPEDRTGLYLFPLFIGAVFFALDSFDFRRFDWLKYSILPIVVLIPIHFLWSMNISHSTFWKSELIPHRFINKVIETKPEFTIGGDHIRILIWSYYNYRSGGVLNQMQDIQFPNSATDYLLINHLPKDSNKYLVIDFEPISNLYLLENKDKYKWDKLNIQNADKPSDLSSSEFFGIYENTIDSIYKSNSPNRTLAFMMNMKLKTKTAPFNARIVIQISDKHNKAVYYYYQQLNWKKYQWLAKDHTLQFIIPNISNECHYITVYLWNINKAEFQISNMEYGVDIY